MDNWSNLSMPSVSSEGSPQSTSSQSFLLTQSNADLFPQIGNDVFINAEIVAPFLTITEEPLEKFRFRYRSEMNGTHGCLHAQRSERSRKQVYPTVKLCNYNDNAIIRCSIYQYDVEQPHAHRLIQRRGTDEIDDPHDVVVSSEDDFTHSFRNFGIIHTAKKNLAPELVKKKTQLKKEEIARLEGRVRDLTLREEVEIKRLTEDETKSINLNVVRLRFDAFCSSNGILYPLCSPVYSKSISNLKSALTGELKIVRMDHCSSPAKGGQEVFILVERVTKKNIKVRFFEGDDEDDVVWEDYGRFSELDVHHQYAIVFKTPPYRDPNISNPVKVYIQLERISDKTRSEPIEFIYTVSSHRPGGKRARTLSTEELSAPIGNENMSNIVVDITEPLLTPEELQEAVTNIQSDEFDKLYDAVVGSYSWHAIDSSTSFETKGGSCKTKEVVLELKNFVKTHPHDDKAVTMLKHHLLRKNETNVLHMSIKQNQIADVMFLLKMLYFWKQHELVNVRDDNYQTALHIATCLNSEEIVANLIVCKADVSLRNGNMNTALHMGVMYDVSTKLFEVLLSVDNVKNFIDSENCDGNTALNIAIDNNNAEFAKLLCSKGANVNKQHKKNGFTPLRFAIEKQNIAILRVMLEVEDVNPLIEDFQGINSLRAALKKDDAELSEIVRDFMEKNDYSDVEVKSGVDELELIEICSKIKNCLGDISHVSNQPGTWQNLAELLCLGFLLKSGLCESKSTPTQLLLKTAIETNSDIVLKIREFLENLDEVQAVEVIDTMLTS